MSKGKWACRYLFFALLLALCLGFCGYCFSTAEALEAQTQSLAFVDLALESMAKAQAEFDRIEYYRGLMIKGLLAAGAVALATVLLILWHILSAKAAGRVAAKKAKAQKAPEAAGAAPERVCPACGNPIPAGSAFCDNCGAGVQ